MFLTRAELRTHLYAEVIKEINREDNLIEYATLAGFPDEGESNIFYVALDTFKYYKWATNDYAEISYSDNSIEAIKAAIEEARSYLTAYDTTAIFNAEGDERNPILLLYVKDIAVWHYIQLANPAVDMQLRLERYEKAVKWLEKVQSGKANPNLPYPAVTPPNEPNNYLKWGGNIKRNNNF